MMSLGFCYFAGKRGADILLSGEAALNRISSRAVVISVVVFNALILFFCLAFFVPRALNNDDWIIHGITAGAYGEHSAVTAHTNVILAAALAGLQKLFSGVNWFAVFETALCFLTFCLFGSIVILNNRSFSGSAVVAAVTVFAAPDFYLNIHNTKLAPIAAAVGLAAIFHRAAGGGRFFAVCGWAAALSASFLRLNAFLIGAAFAAGIGLALLVADGADFSVFWRKNRRAVRDFLFFFATVAVFTAADAVIIRALPGGAEYREYNAARGMVSDFAVPDYHEFAADYEALGISENDWRMIDGWNFSDFEKFDTKTLIEIANIRKTGMKGGVFEVFAAEIINAVSDMRFLFAAAAVIFCAAVGDRKSRTAAVWSIAVFFGCVLFMCVIGRVTHWVMSGLTGCLMLTPAVAFCASKRGKTVSKYVLPTALFVCAAVLSVAGLAPKIGSYRDGFNVGAGEIFLSLGEMSDDLFLLDSGTDPSTEIHRIIPAFSATPKGYFNNCYSLGGWDSNSPAKNRILERFGIEGSPYRALLENDGVFLVDTKSYHTKLTFLRENYDKNTSMSLVGTVDGYYVFAFERGAEHFQNVTESRELTISETDISTDEVIADFTYIGVTVDGAPEDVSAAYLLVTNIFDDTSVCYRARFIRRDGGYAVLASVSFTDILIPDEYTVRVLFKTKNGLLATAQTMLVS